MKYYVCYFFVGFVTVALAYQAKFFKYHICLLFSFVVLGTFLAVRYDFGNDYMPYMLMHKELQNMSIFNSHYEFGWIILNKFVYNFICLWLFCLFLIVMFIFDL